MNTHSIKYFLVGAGLLLLVGAGCQQSQTNVADVSNTATTEERQVNAVVEDRIQDEEFAAEENPIEIVDDEQVDENSNEEDLSVDSDEIDTSDWLTYENEEYGFSFMYPNDLEIEVRPDGNIHDICILDPDRPFDQCFMILSFIVNSDVSFDDWFNQNVDVNNVLQQRVTETKNGYKKIIPYGASNIEDLGGYGSISSFIEDNVNKRVVAVYGAQDFSGLEKFGYFGSFLVTNIVNALDFHQLF